MKEQLKVLGFVFISSFMLVLMYGCNAYKCSEYSKICIKGECEVKCLDGNKSDNRGN